MNLQAIFDIAEICAKKCIRHAVISPGSRNALLTLAFVRHPSIKTFTFSDERSAGFAGLGMTLKTQKPAALISTSGTAVYNYAPAIAEAFFQQVPLLILTADRPPEWLDQQDGQSIRQNRIYGDHVKQSFSLPSDLEHPDGLWHAHRVVSEAINLATSYPAGPVHINIPFREPFYAQDAVYPGYSKNVKIIEAVKATSSLDKSIQENLTKELKKFTRILVIGGQDRQNPNLNSHLAAIHKMGIPVSGDVISNLHGIEEGLRYADIFLMLIPEDRAQSLRPDLLITFGKSVISKSLKMFLRKYRPNEHWHIQPAGTPPDTFQCLTRHIHATPDNFFHYFEQLPKLPDFDYQKQENFLNLWRVEDIKAHRLVQDSFNEEQLGEFEAVSIVMQHLPGLADLHLANSMPVRLANFIGLDHKLGGVQVFSNRGTSGIDGSNSTAMGASLLADHPVVLLTGDMAFFYDRNAFWHNYNLKNLRIIILNNHAGGIFGLIDGPAQLPELEEYFETKQPLTAKLCAQEFGFEYKAISNKYELASYLEDFFAPGQGCKILEVETDLAFNKKIFKTFKEKIKKL